MPRQTATVRVSSKGQIVIPAALRRKLGLRTGQSLRVRAEGVDSLVLVRAALESDDVDEIRERMGAWCDRTGRDPVEELDQERRRERSREAAGHGRRRS